MNQSVINLYDEYTHKPLPRREFMERLVVLTGSIAAANGALALLEPNAALAQTIAVDDPRLVTQDAMTIAEGVKGYMARPREAARKGFVIVVHENRGLNAHIRDVARRMALGGFVAFAPDYLTPLGGTPADPDAARDLFAKLPAEAVIDITKKAIAYGDKHPEASGKTGIVGFCWGGGVVNRAAVMLPELAAGVVYYGVAPDVTKTGDIKAALMVHLAGLDDRVNATYPAYEAALKAASKNAVVHRYEGVNHAFNNDTSAERFNKAAADLAWERTLAFFGKELTGTAKSG
ncbi:MAG: dienelactone hydrolase family protein [Beijerinckiaceae bacterium]